MNAKFAALVDAANLDEAGASAELLAEFSEATRTLQAVCPHLLMRREGRRSCLAITWRCDCCGRQHVPVGMRVRESGEGDTVFTVARVEGAFAWLDTDTHSLGWKNLSKLSAG